MDYILSIQGHGDALISAYYAEKSETKFCMICDSTSKEIIRFFFPDLRIESDIYRPIYDIKKSSLKEIIKASINLIKKISSLCKDDTIYFEKRDIRSFLFRFFTKAKIKHVSVKDNIYYERAELMGVNMKELNTEDQQTQQLLNINSVLCLPISRIQKKTISKTVLHELKSYFNKKKIKFSVGKFYTDQYDFSGFDSSSIFIFRGIDELITHMDSSDLIITCDSLPLHISYLKDYNYRVLFNNYINSRWLPPGGNDKYILIKDGETLDLEKLI